jgi:CBS domain-containing protein
MGAILGGTMRSPFTGVIFALELTHDVNMLVPLLLAVTISHGFTVLTLRRSILTEKVARRGYHLSREYAVDPLEILFARDVMRQSVLAFPAAAACETVANMRHPDQERKGQALYPVVDDEKRLVGVVTRKNLAKILQDRAAAQHPVANYAQRDPVVAYEDEPLRVVVYRMAETGLTRFPVVAREDSRKLVGMISLYDLLHARTRTLEEERRRERVLRIHLPFRSRDAVAKM